MLILHTFVCKIYYFVIHMKFLIHKELYNYQTPYGTNYDGENENEIGLWKNFEHIQIWLLLQIINC